jgi:hypothetical protein
MVVALTPGAGERREEAADGVDARVVARRIDHRAVPDDVVGDDQAAAAGENEAPSRDTR